jgi:hypothetical protein
LQARLQSPFSTLSIQARKSSERTWVVVVVPIIWYKLGTESTRNDCKISIWREQNGGRDSESNELKWFLISQPRGGKGGSTP